jgi:hypothetical protein
VEDFSMATLTSPFSMLRTQRSHLLFVLSNPRTGSEIEFLQWYQSAYRDAISTDEALLRVRQYERHEVDITAGRHPPLPFRYLGLHELSIDGAQAAAGVIDRITQLHQAEAAAEAPATWLYYPAGEKVGRLTTERPLMLTLAFANAVVGQEGEFREWYATRHIRHALHVPALVSGQTLERTLFQRPGVMQPGFATIAMYEQEGTPEEILQSFASLPPATFHFPSMDLNRFAEWVYRPM